MAITCKCRRCDFLNRRCFRLFGQAGRSFEVDGEVTAMKALKIALVFCALTFGLPNVSAQHLFWKPKPGPAKYTCLYGEIEVLATGPTIYYFGFNWLPRN